jgi:hypothetical protein
MNLFSTRSRKRRTQEIGSQRTARPSHVFRPLLEELEDRTLLANRLDPLSNALSLSLAQLGSSVQAAVQQSTTALPVLNRPLGDITELTNIVGRFQNVISDKLKTLNDADLTNALARDKIQEAIFQALTQEQILGDRNGDAAFRTDDVWVAPGVDLDAGNVTIEVRLTGSTNVASQSFSFGTGLPGLPLEVESTGNLSVTVGFDYANLKFGLSNGTFFLDTAAPNKFTASVTAALSYAEMSGIVGFLEMKATPDPETPTQLKAEISFDVQGNAPNITVASSPLLGGSADVKLKLNAGFTGIESLKYQIPAIDADFQMHWDLGGSRLDSSLSQLGAAPTVSFNNVRVSMGEFLGRTLAPILQDVQTALKPLQPIFTVLNYRIPGLSDLMEAGGGGPVTLLTLAKAAAAIDQVPDYVKQIVEVTETVNEINALVESIAVIGDDAWLPVGSFNLNEANPDLRGLEKQIHGLKAVLRTLGPTENLTSLKTARDEAVSTLGDLIKKAPISSLKEKAKTQLLKLSDKIAKELSKTEDGLKLEFPILQLPAKNALGLLIGQDADFVTFTAQYQFNAKVEENYKLFSFLGVDVRGFLRGELKTLNIWFKMGYDTFGVRQYRRDYDLADFVKGFYLDTSRDLVRLEGSVDIGLAATIPLIRFEEPIFHNSLDVSAGVEIAGGLTVDGSVRLPDGPGHRFRISEKADHLFETAGTVSAGIKFAVVAHTPFPILDDIVLYSKTIASHTLIDLNSEFHKANPFKTPADLPPTKLPVITDLNAFPQANDGVPNRIYMEESNGQYVLRAYNGTDAEPFCSVNKPVNEVASITALGGGDDDFFYPGKVGGSIFTTGVPVTIDGRGGHNFLEVHTSAPQALRSQFVFSNGHMSGPFELSYQGIDEIAAYAVGGHHTSQIRELKDGLKLTIFGSNHSNSFIVGNGNVGGITGELVLHGGAGTDTLEFDDRNNPFAARWVITDTAVRRLMNYFSLDDFPQSTKRFFHVATVELALNNIDRVTVRGGTTSIHLASQGQPGLIDVNRFEIQATSLPVTIIGGSSSDHYILGSETEQTRAPSYSNVSITDTGGHDTLVLNERGVKFPTLFGLPPHVVYTVDGTSIARRETSSSLTDAPTTIAINGVEDVRLYGGNYPGTEYRITGFQGGDGGSLLSVYTGTESDVVTLGTYPGGLGKFRSNVLLYDTGGNDLLTVNAQNVTLAAGDRISSDGTGDSYTADGRLLSPTGTAISYTNFEALFVRAPVGSSVTVQALAEKVHAAIFGAARVNLGGGRLDNIAGTVDVRTDDGRQINSDGYRGNATTALTVDDSLNPTPASYTLGPSWVSVCTPGDSPFFDMTIGSAVVTLLELLGGSGGNAITLTDTQASPSLQQVVLNTGLGADTVTIERTHTAVTINGQRGRDTVNVGLNGNMQGIFGLLTITNLGEWSTVTLDDSADTDRRTVDLRNSGLYSLVSGLAPATVRVRQRDLAAFTILGGSGNNTFTVSDTPRSTIPTGMATVLRAGSGNDVVSVLGTTGALVIDSQGSLDQISLGAAPGQPGTLDRLTGNIELRGREGGSFNQVSINDARSGGRYTYTLEANRFYRTDQATGVLRAGLMFGAGLITDLRIVGANNGNSFQVNGTPTLVALAGTTVSLATGAGADHVRLFGTSGPVNVDLGPGPSYQSITIGDATHSLDAIRGRVSIDGTGYIDAFLSDEASTTPHTVTVSVNQFGGQAVERGEIRDGQLVSLNVIQLGLFGRVASRVSYRTGQAGDTVNVLGTSSPLVVNGGPGNDTIAFGDPVAGLDPIPGRITVNGGDGTNTLLVNDQATKSSATWTRTPTSITRLRLDGVKQYRTQIDHKNVQNVVIHGGSGANTLRGDAGGSAAPLTMILPVGGSGYDDGASVTTDAAGNIYTCGYFQGMARIVGGPGAANLTATGLDDSYVAKYTPTGNLVWAQQLSSSTGEIAEVDDLRVDGAGNVYVTGAFSGAVTLGPTTLTCAGSIDGFLAKLDGKTGKVLWVRQLAGAGYDAISEVAVDAAGNAYVNGWFSNTATLAGRSFTGTGKSDGFVARFNSAGMLQWAQVVTGTGEDNPWSMALDARGNVYTTGSFTDTVTIGSQPLQSRGDSDGYLVKLDSRGQIQWARQLGGTGRDYMGDVGVDAAGNVYTTGGFVGTMTLGNTTLTSKGATDAFVTKLSSNGDFLWSRSMGSAANDWGGGLAVDAAGNTYYTGWFAGPGSFEGQATTAATYTGFLGKLNAAGNPVWTQVWGNGAGGGWGYRVALDGAGHIYVAGGFDGTADQDPGAGTFTMTSAGVWDAAVLQFTEVGPR